MKFGLKSKKEKKESDLVPDNPKKSRLEETPISESDLISISESELFSENTSTFMDLKKLEYQKYPVYVGVARDLTATGERIYKVVEPSLTKKDQENFALIKKILMQELTIDLNDIKTKELAEHKLTRKIIQIVKKYDLKVDRKSLPKILYHAVRDFIHLGRIEALMHDSAIEEISCDGMGIPIFIYHKDYESIPSNIVFPTHEELDNFARKIAYISGMHVSVAQPIVDASLPNGDRINITLGQEITKHGSTFTIRRFKTDPVTVIDLIKWNTMSSDMASYFWYLVEHKAKLLLAGGTASGKTTTLNTISSFISPGSKVVSIEDTPELNLPHENWIPAVSRESFTGSITSEITQFDLLRAALRQRPDIIIVGETRGKEAFTLFQALATGHGGYSSIHADSVSATLNRLTTEPMNIPREMVAYTLDIVALQLKLNVKGKSVRRIMQISEINGIDDETNDILFNDVFRWNPVTDKHVYLGKSTILEKLGKQYGESMSEIIKDLSRRKTALEWMIDNNIREQREVYKVLIEFHNDPIEFNNKRQSNYDSV